MKKLEKDYKDSIYTLEKSKNKFLTNARNAEAAVLDAEIAKSTNITPNEKEKFINKANSALKDAKESEKTYISNLNFANSVRVAYIEGMKSILFNYQYLEEEFIEYTKNVLRKLCFFSNASSKNILFDIDKCREKIEEINMKNDISNFIEANQTNAVPPLQIEYVPYSIFLRSKPIEEFNYPLEVIYNVIVSLQSSFEKSAQNEYVF